MAAKTRYRYQYQFHDHKKKLDAEQDHELPTKLPNATNTTNITKAHLSAETLPQQSWLIISKLSENEYRSSLAHDGGELISILTNIYLGDIPEPFVRCLVEKSFNLRGALYHDMQKPFFSSHQFRIEYEQSEMILRTLKRQSRFPPTSYILFTYELMSNFKLLEIPELESPISKLEVFRQVVQKALFEWRRLPVGDSLRIPLKHGPLPTNPSKIDET